VGVGEAWEAEHSIVEEDVRGILVLSLKAKP
jgi:hypothetical protein